jgi:mRNA deadenylase 3'-5' endonuclease subunit Ccr4
MDYEYIKLNKADKPDFVLIGWKRSKFKLVSNDFIIFRDHLPTELKNSDDYKKGDIALIAKFMSIRTKKEYNVINCHLFWNTRKEEVQFLQACLVKRYILLNLKADDKLFLCGDFNSKPFSNVFRLICFNASPEHSYSKEKNFYNQKAMDFIYSEILKPFLKDMKIYSAYGLYEYDKAKSRHQHPRDTQYSATARGYVDYIFYPEKAKFQISQLLRLPSYDVLEREQAIPNRYFPSDHLPVMMEVLSE